MGITGPTPILAFPDQIIAKLAILGMAKRADWEDPEVASSHRHTTVTFTVIYKNSLKSSSRRKHKSQGGGRGDNIVKTHTPG